MRFGYARAMTCTSSTGPVSRRPGRAPALFTALGASVALAGLLFGASANAHQTSDSYLVIDATQAPTLELRWDVAVRDLERVLALPAAPSDALAVERLLARRDDIDHTLLGRLTLSVDGHDCRLLAWRHAVRQHSDGRYVETEFHSDCRADGHVLLVAYSLLFDLDPLHRGLLRLRAGSGTRTAVLGPGRSARRFELARPGMAAQIREYFVHGVWHIWKGLDHVLFLLALLLPSVLRREHGRWQGTPRLRTCLIDVLRVVTAFTLAHSITLSLAALGMVMLPARLVESTIAASVLLAALNNLWPLVGEGRWVVAFAFGLIHGFGFASVLTDLGLPRDALAGALVGFNLGVEAGQLAIVLAFIPLAWPLRTSRLYRYGVLGLGSAAVAALSTIWLIERVFDLRILPFTV